MRPQFRARGALGAAALAAALLTSGCSLDDVKNAACSAASSVDGFFDSEPSAERQADCVGRNQT